MFLVISLGGMVYVSFCDHSTSIIIFMCFFIVINSHYHITSKIRFDQYTFSIGVVNQHCEGPVALVTCFKPNISSVAGEKVEELYFVVHEFKLPYLARIFMIKSIKIIELL